VLTEDEALEHIVALLQMYREQGHYLERIYKWAKRVGIEEIRQQIMQEPERRRGFFERFVASQSVAQVDPWAARAAGAHQHEFIPLSLLPEEVES
jgi:nitrite reductase (NADH) large subunit